MQQGRVGVRKRGGRVTDRPRFEALAGEAERRAAAAEQQLDERIPKAGRDHVRGWTNWNSLTAPSGRVRPSASP